MAEKITNNIHQHFSGGYNLIWNDRLNHWLVDYDIIKILKNHMGYTSWSEVPMIQQELCCRDYGGNNELPPCNIQQEGYWPSVTWGEILTICYCHQIIPMKNYLTDLDCKCGQEKGWVRVRVTIICFWTVNLILKFLNIDFKWLIEWNIAVLGIVVICDQSIVGCKDIFSGQQGLI